MFFGAHSLDTSLLYTWWHMDSAVFAFHPLRKNQYPDTVCFVRTLYHGVSLLTIENDILESAAHFD